MKDLILLLKLLIDYFKGVGVGILFWSLYLIIKVKAHKNENHFTYEIIRLFILSFLY